MPSPSPQRFRQADAILDAALDLEEGERAAFVDRACEGNPALRSQVHRLLRAIQRSEGFLAGAAVDLARPLLDANTAPELDAPAPTLPEHVGPYRVISELGRAEWVWCISRRGTTTPLGRWSPSRPSAAAASPSGTVLRRFPAEPASSPRSITRTWRDLEAGITPDGAPYFAMAYSPGGSLADAWPAGRSP